MTPKKLPLSRSQKIDAEHDDVIIGLENFRLKIERDFFCDVAINFLKEKVDSYNLIIDISFNFDLEQGLSILADRKVGDLDLNSNNNTDYLYLNQLKNLAKKSNKSIDIEELNLVFNNCTVVIHKIFEQSISYQLKNIIQNINNNLLYFSKGFTEIPYEVHIPIFEAEPFNTNADLMNIRIKEAKNYDYSKFWALYFETRTDASIYDVEHHDIIDGELMMIKQ